MAQTRVLVLFLLNLVFAELRRQLELPPERRVRVGLKLDEARLVMGALRHGLVPLDPASERPAGLVSP